MMTPFAQRNCRQPRHTLLFAGLARIILMACLMAAALLGPVAGMAASPGDHPDAITAGLADGATEAPAHCDPGPPCAAFIVPAHMTASQTTLIMGTLVRARDKFQRHSGGPAIDLPPPRRFA